MSSISQNLFAKLERQKQTMLAELAPWPMERTSLRPGPAEWSALDVLDHLIKVEIAFLRSVRKHLPNGHPITARERLQTMLVISLMKSPLRVKVPAASKMVLPDLESDPSGMAARWSLVRSDIGSLLQSIQPEQLRCGLFRHPVGGWMAIPNALAFLSAHLSHHRYQIRRIEAAVHLP